eukprot:PhM_4_TR10045/c0_g1_i2/m.65597
MRRFHRFLTSRAYAGVRHVGFLSGLESVPFVAPLEVTSRGFRNEVAEERVMDDLSTVALEDVFEVNRIDIMAQARIQNFLRRNTEELNSASLSGDDVLRRFEIHNVIINGSRFVRAELKLRALENVVGYIPISIGYSRVPRDACHLAAMHAEEIINSLGVQMFCLKNAQRKYASARRDVGSWAPMPEDKPRQGVLLPKPLAYLKSRNVDEKGLDNVYNHFVVVRFNNMFFTSKYAMLSPVSVDELSKQRISTFIERHGSRISECISMSKYRNNFHVKIHLPLSPQLGERIAEGVAEQKGLAIVLACMHAELIIDTLGIYLYEKADHQIQHARQCSRYGRSAPFPGDSPCPPDTPSPPPLRMKGTCAESGEDDALNVIDSYLDDYIAAAAHTQYEDIQDIDFDAAEKIEAFLEQAGYGDFENYLIQRLGRGDSTTFKAMILLPVPQELGKRFGVGIGSTPARARLIAAMHAVRVLDALNVCVWGNDVESQRVHMESQRAKGRRAPMPGDQLAPPTTESPPALRLSGSRGCLPKHVQLSDAEREEEMKAKIVSPKADTTPIPVSAPTPMGPPEGLNEDVDGYILIPPDEQLSTSATSFHTLASPRKFDSEAIARIRDFLIRHGQKPESLIAVKDVGDLSGMSFYQCKLKLPLPVSFGERFAIGEAPTQQEATILCHMHAEVTLDTLGIHLYDSSVLQRKHALTARSYGRQAPMPGEEPAAADTPTPPALRKERRDSMRWLRFLRSKFGNETDVSASHIAPIKQIDWTYVPDAELDHNAKIKLYHYFITNPRNRTLTTIDDRFVVSAVGENLAMHFHCKLMVPVPESRGSFIEALGSSANKEEAEMLCCMHAIRIIDALGLRLFFLSGMQDRHVDRVRKEGRWARYTSEQLTTTNFQIPNPLRKDYLGSPPKPPHFVEPKCTTEEWIAYIPECEVFIKEMKDYHFKRSIAMLKVPRTGDKFVDDALDVVEAQPIELQARARLYNYCLLAGLEYPRVDAKEIGENQFKRFYLEMPLPGHVSLKAYGAALSKDDVLRRTSMHALEMLQKLDPNFSSMNLTSGRMSATKGIEKGALTDEGKQRVLDLYCLVHGIGRPTTSFMGASRNGMFVSVARTELHGHEGISEHTNRGTAEQQANTGLFTNLVKQVPMFREINSFLKYHPFFSVGDFVSLSIEDHLVERMRSVIDRTEALDFTEERANEDTTSKQTSDIMCQRTPQFIESQQALLLKALRDREENPKYVNMFAQRRQSLPIAKFRDQLIDVLYNQGHNVLVLCGTTGCGKTTQIPQYLLEHEVESGRGGSCNIICTQPRRISAVSIASRIADERLEAVGDNVGYVIRLDSRPGKHLTLVTSGVLLRMLKGNPRLEGISHVLVDEIHERDINSDFLLILLRDLALIRPDLKIILMSATLQARLFSDYFRGAPVLEAEGGVFPVQEYFMEDIAKLASEYEYTSPMLLAHSAGDDVFAMEIDYQLLAFIVSYLQQDMGEELIGHSILFFLPGWEEIVAAKNVLTSGAAGDPSLYHVILLHSTVSQSEQVQCFIKPPPGKIKLILSTNIAESGITIDDIKVVVDLGRMKEKSFVHSRGKTSASKDEFGSVSQLVTVPASRANCVQRRGRAGRTRGGVCFRLYTRDHFNELPDFQTPELLRQPLDSLCLSILHLRLGEPSEILSKALECPTPESVDYALQRLADLGALDTRPDGSTGLTPLGQKLALLPVVPRIGKIIIFGMLFRCMDTALTLAASAESDPFVTAKEVREEAKKAKVKFLRESMSDHIMAVNAFNAWVSRATNKDPLQSTHPLIEFETLNYLNHTTLTTLSRYKRQFAEIIFHEILGVEFPPVKDHFGHKDTFVERTKLSAEALNVPLIKGILCAGLFPNIAMHREKKKLFRTKFDNSLVLQSASVMNHSNSFGTGACSPFVIFEEKVRLQHGVDANGRQSSLTIFRSGSIVGFWQMLLFGATAAHVSDRRDLGMCLIDDWIPFRFANDTTESEHSETLRLVMEFKHAMNRSINRTLLNPRNKANNKIFNEMRSIVSELISAPIIPNQLNPEKWEEKGEILPATMVTSIDKEEGLLSKSDESESSNRTTTTTDDNPTTKDKSANLT